MMNDFEEIDNDKSYTQINGKMYRAHRIVVGHVFTLRNKIQSLQFRIQELEDWAQGIRHLLPDLDKEDLDKILTPKE